VTYDPIIRAMACMLFTLASVIGLATALPATAQNAASLELAPGMRAYTTRVFVAPKVLAGLSVGDEVSVYTTRFMPWDYPHAEGYKDTYVAETVAQDLRFLGTEVLNEHAPDAPLVEVSVRVEGAPQDIMNFVMSGYYPYWAGRSYPLYVRDGKITARRIDSLSPRRDFFWGYPSRSIISEMLVLANGREDLPVYCEGCETISVAEYYRRKREASNSGGEEQPVCYSRVRRGVELTEMEIPCRGD